MRYEKINLRALEPEDLELLYEWENNESYWIISNTVVPFSKYTLKRYLENSHKNIYETGQLRLMIETVSEKKAIGAIDVFDEKERRKGYATMALKGLVSYCFSTLQLHQVYCNILSNNCESIELFRKLGFVRIGIKKDWIKSSEGWLDEHLFQLVNKKKNKDL
jgi:diamine N-acetyltransferase